MIDMIRKALQNPFGRTIAWAKAVGLTVGLTELIIIRQFSPDIPWSAQFGIVAWGITIAALIASLHFVYNTLLELRIPWWVSGPGVASWMFILLVLFAHNDLNILLAPILYFVGMESLNIFCMLALALVEGTVFGLLIGFVVNRQAEVKAEI